MIGFATCESAGCSVHSPWMRCSLVRRDSKSARANVYRTKLGVGGEGGVPKESDCNVFINVV